MNKGPRDYAWRLNLDECMWQHDMWCTSKQNVSVAELTSDSTFVEDMNTFGTGTTGKCSAQSSLGRGGRVAGGVSARNARRAQNEILNQDGKEYEADWCKIAGWGRAFVQKNPGSMFHVGKDEHNRYNTYPTLFLVVGMPKSLVAVGMPTNNPGVLGLGRPGHAQPRRPQHSCPTLPQI